MRGSRAMFNWKFIMMCLAISLAIGIIIVAVVTSADGVLAIF